MENAEGHMLVFEKWKVKKLCDHKYKYMVYINWVKKNMYGGIKMQIIK